MSEIKNVTSLEELKEIIESNDVVVADFWAAWCGPCRAFSPLIDRLAVDDENVTVVKVDVDAAQDIAAAFQVQSIPTVFGWSGEISKGKKFIGVRPYETLQDFVKLVRDDK